MSNKLVVIIDGQGGKIGRELCDRLLTKKPDCDCLAIGTNSSATMNMLKGKVKDGATGENPILVASRKATVIAGPLGLVVADSLMGEITPKMAVAIGQSDAHKILIPTHRCGTYIVGLQDKSINELLDEAVQEILNKIQ